MKELNIAICDDDIHFAERLRARTAEMLSNNGIVNFKIEIYSDGEKLINSYTEKAFDIVMTDVDMPKVDGFDVVDNLRQLNPDLPIIFVTAYRNLAYRAYDYDPVGFADKQDLKRLDYALKTALNIIKKQEPEQDCVLTLTENGVEVSVMNTIFLDTYKNYIEVHCTDNESFTFRGTIKNVYKHLKNYGFVLVQNGCIVNCRYIKRLSSKRVILEDGTEIPMTRDKDKSKEAIELYGKFVRENL